MAEPLPADACHARRTATRAAFFVTGLCMSAWAPLVPYAKARLHVSEGQLSLLLLCLGSGSVLTMPLSGGLVGRFGCRRVMAVAAAVACATLPVLALDIRAARLGVALACFGAAIGTLDVSMNVHAVLVERAAGRAMMSGFHGLYSVGGMAGSGLVGLVLSTGTAPVVAAGMVSAVALLLVGLTFGSLLPTGGDRGGPAVAVPRGAVLLLGAFCFVLFLAEGSVLDWSGVFLTTVRHVGPAHAGLGYVAFSAFMTVCRLTGDRIVPIVGPRRVVLIGGLAAAVGFALAAAVPSAAVAIVGFGLVGLGAANAVPVLFSAAGRQSAMPTHLAIAAMTDLGYAGLLVGPALVGGVASAAGLSVGLLLVAAMLVAVAVTSARVPL